jgi:MFS transporter, FHS family, L-fucose permease
MEFQAETTHANTAVKPFYKQYRLFHAAFAQFCYTGAQVAIAGKLHEIPALQRQFAKPP